jgi:hypothetical protein
MDNRSSKVAAIVLKSCYGVCAAGSAEAYAAGDSTVLILYFRVRAALFDFGGGGERARFHESRVNILVNVYFRERIALLDHTVRGALSPPHTARALGSATQGHSRDRDSRAALGNPQKKRHIRQTYSGRSARDATRPESQAAYSIFRCHCHLPAMILLAGGYARSLVFCFRFLHSERLTECPCFCRWRLGDDLSQIRDDHDKFVIC